MMTNVESKSTNERDDEKAVKTGYYSVFQERHPINDSAANCDTEKSAYFLFVEQKNMEVPDYLEWDALNQSIDEKHHTRFRDIWRELKDHYTKFSYTAETLKDHWNHAPRIRDAETDEFLKDTPLNIQPRFKLAIKACIGERENRVSEEAKKQLRQWKVNEKTLRGGFYKEQKTYISALRLYYEMLLESSPDKSEYVLPKNHPLREEIARRNRYLRVIDATYQGISVAKAAHNEQKQSRVRKAGESRSAKIPYLIHALDVTASIILDVIPHVIEETRLKLDPVLLIIIGPIHDIVEETNLNVKDVCGMLKGLADKYDSSVNPVIVSGFEGVSREDIKRKVLDLIGENNSRTIAQLLRILSDNQPLTDEEMKTALTDNIAGEDTAIAIGIDSNSEKALRKKWRLEGSLPPPAKTFQEFPVTHDGRKLTAFLVRMKAITSSKRKQQYVLMAKMADRANNVSHPVETWHPRKKREIIRDTVSRLIAWGMLDHNNENYPLYNILPRLIDKTIRAYKRLKEESPQSIEQLDSQYMAQLQTWSTKVKRWQVPEEVQAVLDNYNSTKKAA